MEAFLRSSIAKVTAGFMWAPPKSPNDHARHVTTNPIARDTCTGPPWMALLPHDSGSATWTETSKKVATNSTMTSRQSLRLRASAYILNKSFEKNSENILRLKIFLDLVLNQATNFNVLMWKKVRGLFLREYVVHNATLDRPISWCTRVGLFIIPLWQIQFKLAEFSPPYSLVAQKIGQTMIKSRHRLPKISAP